MKSLTELTELTDQQLDELLDSSDDPFTPAHIEARIRRRAREVARTFETAFGPEIGELAEHLFYTLPFLQFLRETDLEEYERRRIRKEVVETAPISSDELERFVSDPVIRELLESPLLEQWSTDSTRPARAGH